MAKKLSRGKHELWILNGSLAFDTPDTPGLAQLNTTEEVRLLNEHKGCDIFGFFVHHNTIEPF